jgi:hypothetical protein
MSTAGAQRDALVPHKQAIGGVEEEKEAIVLLKEKDCYFLKADKTKFSGGFG